MAPSAVPVMTIYTLDPSNVLTTRSGSKEILIKTEQNIDGTQTRKLATSIVETTSSTNVVYDWQDGKYTTTLVPFVYTIPTWDVVLLVPAAVTTSSSQAGLETVMTVGDSSGGSELTTSKVTGDLTTITTIDVNGATLVTTFTVGIVNTITPPTPSTSSAVASDTTSTTKRTDSGLASPDSSSNISPTFQTLSTASSPTRPRTTLVTSTTSGSVVTTLRTITATRSSVHPPSTSKDPNHFELPTRNKKYLPLEIALPICLVVVLLLLALLWNRKRRQNENRYSHHSDWKAPSPSQRKQEQSWWERKWGRQARRDDPQIAEVSGESGKLRKRESRTHCTPQKPGERAEIGERGGGLGKNHGRSLVSPQGPGEVAEAGGAWVADAELPSQGSGAE